MEDIDRNSKNNESFEWIHSAKYEKIKPIELRFLSKHTDFVYLLASLEKSKNDENNLYPHTMLNYVVIVPNDKITKIIMITDLINYSEGMVLIFVLLRFLIRIMSLVPNDVCRSSIWIDTMGMAIGFSSHGSDTIKNRPERILVFTVSVFAILIGTLYSGIAYQQITERKSILVNSIENVIQLKMQVYAPIEFQRVSNFGVQHKIR